MTKFFLVIIACSLLACNNSGEPSTTADSTAINPTNVENVNGNMPDTASGMNLNQPLPVDSSGMKDSAKKDSSRH